MRLSDAASPVTRSDLDGIESNARTYARSIPIVISRALLSRVWDVNGREFIDCLACAGALPLGHNHPYVMERVREFLDSGQPLQALDIATVAKLEFVKQLMATLPQSFARSARLQFCGPSGSDAVEAAIKLFKTATGRRSVLAFHGAYHGMTAGSLSLMGNLGPKTPVSGHSPETYFLPFPNAYRCPFGIGDRMGEEVSLRYIDNILSDPESGITKPAMIIVEAIQGEGGCIPASGFWLKGLREITRRHDVPLVVDEVQTGLARTGTMFAFETADIVPDAVILSKAVGGGFPLALVAYADRYDTWSPGAHAGTFRGNQIAFASGAATLQFLRDNGTSADVAGKGELFKECLRDLAAKYPVIGDIRGRGLMLGIEIVDPDGQPDVQGRPPADGPLTRRIKQACLDEGVILESGGRHGAVLRLLPPLIITPEEIETVVNRLDVAISRVLAEAMAA